MIILLLITNANSVDSDFVTRLGLTIHKKNWHIFVVFFFFGGFGEKKID